MRIDTVAPVTVDDARIRYDGPATITLSASDPVSGLESVTWRLDGGAWQSGLTATTSTPGSHRLEFFATDQAGNPSDVLARDFTLYARTEQTDSRIGFKGVWTPYTSASRSGGSYTYSSTLGSVAYIAFDGTAVDLVASKLPTMGIVRVTLDQGAPVEVDLYSAGYYHQQRVYSSGNLTPGIHTLKLEYSGLKNPSASATTINFDALDIAGTLVGAWPVFDTTAPMTTASGPIDWVKGPASVTLSATDGLSGVATTRYRLDGGTVTTYTAPIPLSKEGTTTVEYWSVDVAGNVEETKSTTVRIDDTAPTTTSNALPSYLNSAAITLVPHDTLSGVASTSWRLDGGTWQTGTSVSVATGGVHDLEFRSTDNAGNAETVTVVQFTVTLRYEQSDPNIGWTGSWTGLSSANRSGGSYLYTSSVGSASSIVFTGTGLDVISSKLPNAGIMRVTLDGGTPTEVDLYSPGYYHQQKVLSLTGLTNSVHTLKIECTGLKNPLSSGTQVNLDALDASARLSLWTQRYEQTVTNIAYEGLWISAESAAHSAGAYVYTYAPGAAVNIAFSGTAVKWIAPKGTIYGKAQVSVDGGAPVEIDLYAAKYAAAQEVWSATGLPQGSHTVRIVSTGTKNALSTNAYVGFDAMDVCGMSTQATPPPAIGDLYEQTDTRIVYDGQWTTASHASYSGGSYKYTYAPGAAINVAFDGTDITWIAPKGTIYGKAEVTLDNEPPVVVDLYAAAFLPQSQVWSARGLSPGSHTVRIVYTGLKNASATATNIGIDALRIVGTLSQASSPDSVLVRTEETDSNVALAGSWASFASPAFSGGTYRYSSAASATATFGFNGTGIRWLAPVGTVYGIAQVSIDDGQPVLVDLYRSAYISQVTAWSVSGLTPGYHTIHIVVLGQRNALSTGSAVGLDAFDVTPLE